MRLSDEKIIEAYNSLLASEHPDPTGFIVRSEILSGLDPSRTSGQFIGPFAVNKRKAEKIGVSIEELKELETNIRTAFDIDRRSFDQASGDVQEMHRISTSLGRNKFNSFFKRLEKKKKQLDESLQFDEDGVLISLEKENEIKEEKPEGQVVTESRHDVQPRADDFVGNPKPQLSLNELEQRLNSLILAIVKEVV